MMVFEMDREGSTNITTFYTCTDWLAFEIIYKALNFCLKSVTWSPRERSGWLSVSVCSLWSIVLLRPIIISFHSNSSSIFSCLLSKTVTISSLSPFLRDRQISLLTRRHTHAYSIHLWFALAHILCVFPTDARQANLLGLRRGLLKQTIPTRLRKSCRCISVLLRCGSATWLYASIDAINALIIEARTFTVWGYLAILLLLGFLRLPILAITTA